MYGFPLKIPTSQDYKEYMLSGQGSKLFETKIHSQHVEFLARYPENNGLGGANCGFYMILWFSSCFGNVFA